MRREHTEWLQYPPPARASQLFHVVEEAPDGETTKTTPETTWLRLALETAGLLVLHRGFTPKTVASHVMAVANPLHVLIVPGGRPTPVNPVDARIRIAARPMRQVAAETGLPIVDPHDRAGAQVRVGGQDVLRTSVLLCSPYATQ
jgi:hypothetical protein